MTEGSISAVVTAYLSRQHSITIDKLSRIDDGHRGEWFPIAPLYPLELHTNLTRIYLSYPPQTLEFDREGLTKLKKAVKAIHNSGISEYTGGMEDLK